MTKGIKILLSKPRMPSKFALGWEVKFTLASLNLTINGDAPTGISTRIF